MNNDVIYIFAAIIAGFVLLFYFSRENRIARRFKKTKEHDISVCDDGRLNKVVGKVVYGREQLIAPLSGRTCTAYCVKVIQTTIGSQDAQEHTEILNDEHCVDFFIEKKGALAYIKSNPSELLLHQDANYHSEKLDDASSQRFDGYLNQFDLKSTGVLGFKKELEYREGILEEGEAVAVLGEGCWHNTGEMKALPSGISELHDKIFVFSSSESSPLSISDDKNILAQDEIDGSN